MERYFVRYGVTRILGVFSPPSEAQTFARGDQVIIRTDRGLEAGEVLGPVTERGINMLGTPPEGRILRSMTPDDQREVVRIRRQAEEEIEICLRHVQELGLEMELVDVEHIFGGERIIVYYLADQRVDFRELVRRLAAEFHTRIEMRQIGVRDEAKLLGDYGDCGKQLCCNTHLWTMPPVSMKMAKLQKATLDPAKISGRCGRLKCCLRYEFEQYEELLERLPPVGSEVESKDGPAKVIGHEILAQKVLIETRDRVRKLVALDQVRVVEPAAPAEKASRAAEDVS
ncbi:MAG: signal peptidase [Thermogutta sp.]|nr:signal peptidase [Thermogutta sp.]